MWWSFYEGESSFAKFVDEALKYVSDRPIDAERLPTTYDRSQELRKLLQTKRVLFVLDGSERQLRDYASLSAAYKSDDLSRPSANARSCVDPITSRLLREIAAGVTRTKVLITSRLPISDLEDRAGDTLAGTFVKKLEELPRDDAVSFMRAQGVTKGTVTEIANACETYGFHPLSLRLLSGLIARDQRMPGDIETAPLQDVHAGLIQRQHHVLERSYNALSRRNRRLLSRIAALRYSISYPELSLLMKARWPRDSEERFRLALEDLQRRGLLERDLVRNSYDLHPIVRAYAYDRLRLKKTVHRRLRNDLLNQPKRRVNEVEDLGPILELEVKVATANFSEVRAIMRFSSR